MSDDINGFHSPRQRGNSTIGKPSAPARPAPVLPPPPSSTPAKPTVILSTTHPPKPTTPAPVNKVAGPSKTPPISSTIPPSPTRAHQSSPSSVKTPPPTHIRQPSMEIPPPPPEEEEVIPPVSSHNLSPVTTRPSSKSGNSTSDWDVRKHRLSAGMMVKGPREWQQRWVSLQGRHILAGKRGCEHPIDVPVLGSTVVCDSSDLKQPRFAVLSANGQLCYYFLSLSQGDRTQWLAHLIEQGATVITPPIMDFSNEVDSKGWLKVLSPVGTIPPELAYLDGHVQRILNENSSKREAGNLKQEALAGNMSEIELNKIKMKVSKLEADNSQLTMQLARQKKLIAEFESRNSMQTTETPTSPLRPSFSFLSTPASPAPRRSTVDEGGRDPALVAKDRIIADLTATNARLLAELEAVRAQATQDANTKQVLTSERDEALDLVELVEKAKMDVEQAAEELLAQLTREKQDSEKALRQAREDLSQLQQKQMDEAHKLRKAEEALIAQANFEASAEELMTELTKAKELSEEKLRRAEEMLQRQSAALSLPASTRQSIFVSPQQQQALASAAELELMAEKMALLDEMCIQKEEYDELKQAFDLLQLAQPATPPHAVEERAEERVEESVREASIERVSEVNPIQSSQDLAAKWKQKLEQARGQRPTDSTEPLNIGPKPGTPRAGLSRPLGPPTAGSRAPVTPLSPPTMPMRTASGGSVTTTPRDSIRLAASTSAPRAMPGIKPLDVSSNSGSIRAAPPSPASYGRDGSTGRSGSTPPRPDTPPFPSVATNVRSNSTSGNVSTSTVSTAFRTPGSPPAGRTPSIIEGRMRGKV